MKDVITFLSVILAIALLMALGGYICGPDVPISEEDALEIVREHYGAPIYFS